VLRASEGKSRRIDVREKKTLKDLDSGGKKGDGTIKGAEVKGFTRFPDRGEVSMVSRKIKEFSEIRYVSGAVMLQV
jgi:hypothetical protein